MSYTWDFSEDATLMSVGGKLRREYTPAGGSSKFFDVTSTLYFHEDQTADSLIGAAFEGVIGLTNSLSGESGAQIDITKKYSYIAESE